MEDELKNFEDDVSEEEGNFTGEEPQNAENPEAVGVNEETSDTTCNGTLQHNGEQQRNISAQSKVNPWRIIIAVVLIAVAAIAVLYFCGIFDDDGFHGEASDIRPSAFYGKKDNDGIIWLPDLKGNVTKMGEDAVSAGITPDRVHAVCLYDNGTLCWSKYREAEEIADDNVRELVSIRNSGAVYVDGDGTLRRFLFGKEPELICKDVQYTAIAADALTVLAFADGKVYIMTEDSDDSVKVSKYKGVIGASSISNDGSFAAWSDKSDEEFTLRCAIDYTDEKLGAFEGKSSSFSVSYTLDQKLAVALDLYADKMWIIRNGKLTEVQLKDNAASSAVSCIKGRIDGVKASDVDDIYCMIDDDDFGSIYRISPDGNTEKVIRDVSTFWVVNGKAVWINGDYNLYTGKLKGADIRDKTRLCTDARGLSVADAASVAFFMRDCDDGVCELYAYKLGEDDVVKIASDVHCWMYSFLESYVGSTFRSCIDGKTVLFWTDAGADSVTGDTLGTLYKWTWGVEAPVLIASDSPCGYTADGVNNSTYNQNGFLYYVVTGNNGSGDSLCDWFFFDGTGSMKLAENIVY